MPRPQQQGTQELPLFTKPVYIPRKSHACLADELLAFQEFGQSTRQAETSIETSTGQVVQTPVFVNEFWTARQRQANALHEISYRACFKPQLPRFFIERLTVAGERVYDPFMGRGTTLLEAALLGRVPVGCDVNPLSIVLTRPRLNPPFLNEIAERLGQIDFSQSSEAPEELLVFYHVETLKQISALKSYLLKRKQKKQLDHIDEWIQLVALNRLTGHSKGFFSVYTMPPNQAVSVKSQRKINERRNQLPSLRCVPEIILRKSKQLLKECEPEHRQSLQKAAEQACLLTKACDATPEIPSESIALIVTSPPFLDIVDYAGDNWLRCWFLGIDPKGVQLTVPKKIADWQAAMLRVFSELARVLKPGGHVAFEVGEVHAGKTRLEDSIVPCGHAVGLKPLLIMINDQEFTKTANCWGVDNNAKGTNTNRIVVFRKPA
jgi:hypothetical protein